MSQLQMRWFADRAVLPDLVIPEGFRLRPMFVADTPAYSALRVSAEFNAWETTDMENYLANNAYPDGSLLIEHIASGRFAASAGAEKYGNDPAVGTLGWVMCHPDFRGQHLGGIVSLAAMHLLYRNGCRTFTLLTDDFRLPAIRTYLRLGWHPHMADETMPDRWKAIAEKLRLDPEQL